MNQRRKKNNIPNKDILYKALLFIGTVALIVYFLPRDGKFNYLYALDKPWKYGQLMAPFDFPIYKDESVVKIEQDSLMKAFQPYYQRQQEVEKEALEQLRDDYNSSLRQLFPSTEYVRHIEKKIKEVYESGIISTEDVNRLQEDSVRSIRIITDKESASRATSSIFTVKEAYEYILTADTNHYKIDLLRRAGLNAYLYPNLVYDDQHTATARESLLDNYSWATGLVQSGQKIIDRGEIVDSHTFNILESFRKESIKRSTESVTQNRLILLGQILFVGTLILFLMIYLELYRKNYYELRGRRNLLMLFGFVVFFSVVTALLVSNNLFNVYIVPYAMLPMIVRVFLDSRTAFTTHIITILICSISLRFPHEFILLQVAAGMVSIFMLRELTQRSQLFQMALYILLTYVAVNFAYEMMMENDLTKINWQMYSYFVINAVLLLFAYPLLFLLEKMFGFTSDVTLVELSNINNNLLRKMSEIAPGTFQHSLQVANLAAEAAIRIGAKSQLVRTGALYHDIGKMENPAFFTENQGSFNPHMTLTYEQSAQVVIQHVADGVRLADKNNLPQVIKDFIRTHHGRSKTKYFYISWKNEHPDEEPNDELFTYPGPNPFTKETAILMMADAVEAASRSLPEYTEESISNLVDRVIDGQMEEGSFRQCPITFRDVEIVKSVFKEKLKTIYHTRITYPELITVEEPPVENKPVTEAE